MSLTAKQRAFIGEYVKDFNATQAALRAGYSEKTAYSIGSENLKKPEIIFEVEKHLRQRVMSAEEALARLSDIARADIADFLHVDGNYVAVDVEKAKEAGKTHLIKKYKGRSRNSGEEIELHDSKDALKTLLQVYGRLRNNVTIDWRIEIVEYLRNGQLTPADVLEELGDELAIELFAQAGINASEI